MSKAKFFMSLFGFLVLGFFFGWLTCRYAIQAGWSEQRNSEYSLDIGDVKMGKMFAEGKPVYAFSGKDVPVSVVWVSGTRSGVIKGQDFEVSADLHPNGSFQRSYLKKGGYVYADMNGDGDADARSDENLSKDSLEVRIDGVWHKAPNYKVTINGETFDVEWKNGWKKKAQ